MEWSDLQKGIFRNVAEDKENLFVEAGPGSGKTTTIVEAAKYAPQGSIFLAFNTKIAEELAMRLPPNVGAATMHKYGKNELKNRIGKFKINGGKNTAIIKKKFPEWKEWAWPISKAVGLGKGAGFEILMGGSEGNWLTLLEHHDLEAPEGMAMEKFIPAVRKVFYESLRQRDVIDFEDMIYMPVLFNEMYGWKMHQVPLVFLDEAQDVNSLNIKFLSLFAKRLVAVGDRFQAIYGFRGAGITALEDMEETFNFKYLPLSITYRCPHLHVNVAKERNPELEAAPNADTGKIINGWTQELEEYVNNDTLVVCRNNWPLFEIAIKWLNERRPFQMHPKFPKQLVNFLKSFKAQSISDLRQQLLEWWEDTKEELTKKNKRSMLARQEEKFRALYALVQDSSNVPDCIDKLNQIMQSSFGPRLFTIHGAKGLEAKRVIFYRPELVPSKYAEPGTWQYEQELNMQYVAETRSMDELIYLEGEDA